VIGLRQMSAGTNGHRPPCCAAPVAIGISGEAGWLYRPGLGTAMGPQCWTLSRRVFTTAAKSRRHAKPSLVAMTFLGGHAPPEQLLPRALRGLVSAAERAGAERYSCPITGTPRRRDPAK
jgi:hypothetical protein